MSLLSILIITFVVVLVANIIATLTIASMQVSEEVQWGRGAAKPFVDRWNGYSANINNFSKMTMSILAIAIIVALIVQFIF